MHVEPTPFSYLNIEKILENDIITKLWILSLGEHFFGYQEKMVAEKRPPKKWLKEKMGKEKMTKEKKLQSKKKTKEKVANGKK